MAGLFIYWFGWMLWIIVTFFWSKSNQRLWGSISILVFLSLLPLTIQLTYLFVPVAYLLFALYLCWQIRLYSAMKLAFHFFLSWTIGAAYGAFQLMLLFDPVLAIIDDRWLSALLVSVLAYVLASRLKTRFILALFGLVQGDFLIGLVIGNEVGSLLFFDKVAIVCLFYGVISCMVEVSGWINRILSKQNDTSLKRTS